MASVQVHNNPVFNISDFQDNMGQVMETATSTKTDQEVYRDKQHTASEQQKVHYQTSSVCVTSMELINDVETSYLDNKIDDPLNMQTPNGSVHDDHSELNNSRQVEILIKSNIYHKDEEHLCTGETLDDMSTVPSNNVLEAEVGNRKDNDEPAKDKELRLPMDWAEKKRQFSLMKYQHSEDSLSSDMSSASRHSFSLYLHARQCDAEEVLAGLGFGFEGSMDIPVRFLKNDNYSLIPSHADSSTSYGLQSLEIERPELDEVSSRTSFESSWSNSSFGRLPSRFSSSVSRLSSVSSLISEPDDNENQSVIPSIVEPEKEHDDGFDLMRHLRLNRGQHEKGFFLEPVSEEHEVSSVGSSSARTKVSAPQQDSFDSVGNVSVVTKIFIHKDDSPIDLNHNESERNTSISKLTTSDDSSKEKLIETTKEIVSEVQEICVDKLHLPSMNNLFAPMAQESFELEEIATSEENLDKIEENTPTISIRTRIRLKHDHSDDSSGFEDDGGETSKKSSPEALGSMLKETKSEAAHSKEDNAHLLVPVEVSTPKNRASIRRSTLTKRHSWSTTKQKRVAFEDEASSKCRSFDDIRRDGTLGKRRSRSVDLPLPIINKVSRDLDASRDLQANASPPSNSFDIPTVHSSGAIEADTQCLLVKDKSDNDTIHDKDTLTEKTENAAIRNIKGFISNLLSIRSKLKKNPMRAKAKRLHGLPKSTETEKCDLEQSSIGGDDDPDVRSSSQKASEEEQQILVMPSITLTSYQKSSHHELSRFNDDLQKYRSTFIAMEVISTSQDKYYSRKVQARFAWDILFIRRLRSHINEELDELRSNLYYATELPLGAQSQMNSLLKLQTGLKEKLLALAGSTTDFSPKRQELQSFRVERSIEDIENKIRDSVVQEISSMFQSKISELRDEMKAKDSLIEKLLKRLPEIETS